MSRLKFCGGWVGNTDNVQGWQTRTDTDTDTWANQYQLTTTADNRCTNYQFQQIFVIYHFGMCQIICMLKLVAWLHIKLAKIFVKYLFWTLSKNPKFVPKLWPHSKTMWKILKIKCYHSTTPIVHISSIHFFHQIFVPFETKDQFIQAYPKFSTFKFELFAQIETNKPKRSLIWSLS